MMFWGEKASTKPLDALNSTLHANDHKEEGATRASDMLKVKNTKSAHTGFARCA